MIASRRTTSVRHATTRSPARSANPRKSSGVIGEIGVSADFTAAEQKSLRGLLISGGSDCHGYNKDEPLIGGVKLDDRHLDAMKKKVSSATL